MGVDYTVLTGSFIIFKKEKKEIKFSVEGCTKCMIKFEDNFCNRCGSKKEAFQLFENVDIFNYSRWWKYCEEKGIDEDKYSVIQQYGEYIAIYDQEEIHFLDKYGSFEFKEFGEYNDNFEEIKPFLDKYKINYEIKIGVIGYWS